MAEQVFIIEDETLIKYEADDYAEKVYIPDCVKKTGCRAFLEAPVGKVVIPNGVTVIEPDAFADCSLRKVEIPDSVMTIETWAFSGCEFLREITIPESVTSIGAWAVGYKEDHRHPWLDPIPSGRPVIIYGKKGSEAERYTKDHFWCFSEHITEFREIKTDTEKRGGNHNGRPEKHADKTCTGCGTAALSCIQRNRALCFHKLCASGQRHSI